MDIATLNKIASKRINSRWQWARQLWLIESSTFAFSQDDNGDASYNNDRGSVFPIYQFHWCVVDSYLYTNLIN